ncbi:LPP20 family lipoprotein [Ferrimonas lipolytica]|uniref:Flagellar biosynthesis protein FlgP n=1 Tax=Ferrimonas lipolytica TaxID=2724191 RepID=A0A6H1UEK4_9GAMM|nr:LPP20 family lipoprotein [Ferrimonas lipolytica]QIZ77258.1 flagellar biosynthesis protein FlgP [Ferrimonas lipolytica]
MEPLKMAALATTLLLGGCYSLTTHVEYETIAPESFPVLTATGMAPLSLQHGQTEQEKMRRAMRAAKLDAYRELAEQVFGQRIEGSSDMHQLVLANDNFKVKVDGVIRGATVVRTYPVDDTYVAELELDYRRVWELYQQQPKQRINKVTYY